MKTGIQGKVVLITGASRGIGKAIAVKFASEGARLALCARTEEDLMRTADEITAQTHTEVLTVKANIAKMNDIKRFVGSAAKKFDQIDILINNAGGAHVGGIHSTTEEEWEYHLQLKLLGYIRMAREVIPYMKAHGGRIINIVGVASREPHPLYMVPGVTNSAILNFTKSLGKELEKERILVNSINPATTDTPLTEATIAAIAKIQQKPADEVRASIIASMPQGRFIGAGEIADAALFLASDAAAYISGTSINIDGGKSSGVW